uniref:Glycerophosphoryl diester phosphodiesterase n=1 Tax=uncultured Elusimicrobia bacterium TaxID=699876 RepID=A0A650EMN5_9BACT|nr:glycerophosphoryl diester phosphodiesterase [uncultured Elusimicrobia bacterium]
MIYFAHRGASAEAVQNTLPAFKRAQELGASYYELDVHLTKDGELTVHHDYSLLNTAGTDAEIKNMSFAELRRYPLINAFNGEAVFVPRLEEVLPIIASGLECLNVELKNDDNRYPGIEEKLLFFLQKNFAGLLPKILFSSFDYPTLARLRAFDKTLRIGLLTRAFDVSAALGLGAESVHMNHTRFTPEIAQNCHANGLKIYLYTVNDAVLARQLAASGADGIFTDKIGMFLEK